MIYVEICVINLSTWVCLYNNTPDINAKLQIVNLNYQYWYYRVPTWSFCLVFREILYATFFTCNKKIFSSQIFKNVCIKISNYYLKQYFNRHCVIFSIFFKRTCRFLFCALVVVSEEKPFFLPFLMLIKFIYDIHNNSTPLLNLYD